jgi:C-terminal processing protease CtpA/Prc
VLIAKFCAYLIPLAALSGIATAQTSPATPPTSPAVVPTVLDRDHEFDQGSGLRLSNLSPVQIDNLVTLGRVWGFLKYYHPAVIAGKRHWDYDLFRVLPRVLAAPSRAAGSKVLNDWIDGLGKVLPCAPCAELATGDLQFGPDVGWIGDHPILGTELSKRLTAIYERRRANQSQFYVAIQPQTGQAVFRHELAYADQHFPDPGLQLLILYRFWNIVEYWYPYRDVIGEDWSKVLRDFVPRFAEAPDRDVYVQALMKLIATVHDSHANLWSSLDARPPVGPCRLPINLQFVGGELVVRGSLPGAVSSDSGLDVGDVIASLDGVPVPDLVDRWKPFYGASNDASARRDMALSFTQGPCGDVTVRVTRNEAPMEIRTRRINVEKFDEGAVRRADRPGDTFQRLTPTVSYVKLSSIKLEDIPSIIDGSTGSHGLIVDLRNYPSAFVVFELGGHFVTETTPIVLFTMPDLNTPGAIHWGPTISLAPKQPYFPGKIVILVDEFTQSQAEYTALALRAAPNSIVIGGATAGADGNIDPFLLPGRLNTTMSGIGVFHPDRRPTQRVGIIPDVRVEPTVAGIRAGRDEVLEAAIQTIDNAAPTDFTNHVQ